MANWDLINDICSSLTGWTITKTRLSDISQVTFDNKTTFKFDSGTETGSSTYCRAEKELNMPDNYTVNVAIYFDDIGTSDNSDACRLYIVSGNYVLYVTFDLNGLFIYTDASGNQEVGTDLVVQNIWQIWRFIVDSSTHTCDIYLNGNLVGNDISCNYASVESEKIFFEQWGNTTANRIFYLDQIQLGTGTILPFVDSGLRYRSGSSNIKIGCEILDLTHKLRFRKGNNTVGIPLISTSDYNVSPIRIYDGSNVKSLPKTD